jgi:hypothetical protein
MDSMKKRNVIELAGRIHRPKPATAAERSQEREDETYEPTADMSRILVECIWI